MAHDSLIALTLLRVIALVCALACASWAIMAGPARMARTSTLRFLLANLFLLASVYLTLGRTNVDSPAQYWQSYWLADVLGLLAIALFRQGVALLLALPARSRESALVIALAALGMALLPYPDPNLRWRGILFASAGTWLALQTFRESVGGLRPHFGRTQALAAAAVFGALSIVMFTRVMVLLVWPERAVALESTSVGASVAILWASLVQILLVNIALTAHLLLSLLARIRHLALHDELTGCLNRRAIKQRLDEELQRRLAMRAPGPGTPLGAVVMFDLDHFKRINDEFGHAAGDSALIHVVHVVRAQLRQIDALGRWGGEEFLVVLPLTDVEQAREVATRICNTLAAQTWVWREHSIQVTASFAVAGLQVTGLDFEALDKALYRAKGAGRNCVEVVS